LEVDRNVDEKTVGKVNRKVYGKVDRNVDRMEDLM
jgi:hypothetical protein